MPSDSSSWRNTGVRNSRWLGAVAVSALAVVLSGCGGGSGGDHATHAPSVKPSSPDLFEVRLKQAKAKLTPSAIVVDHDEKGASGGLPETWMDTPDNKAYVFEAACAGNGTMEFYPKTKKPHHEPERWLSCGAKALSYPFQGGDLISVKLLSSGAAGILAWQVIMPGGT